MEFGSDFQLINDFNKIPEKGFIPNPYACGRHAINSLLLFGKENLGWKRLWMPEYFCYTVIESIGRLPIEIIFYPDFPEANDRELIKDIEFKPGDVLFRMNYFGLRSFRDNSQIPVPVIEDHSHALQSSWAKLSNADYCVASLRKSVPLATGGILWSPKNLCLPKVIKATKHADQLALSRYEAMKIKADYIKGIITDKSKFRELFVSTEENLDILPLSGMAEEDEKILLNFDLDSFNLQKKKNYNLLSDHFKGKLDFLVPEDYLDTPFSFPLIFNSVEDYKKIRGKLIENEIYPALLWPLPDKIRNKYKYYLSLHCDGRYSEKDFENELIPRLECILKN